jgi:putative ABC transport system permease protein
VLRTGPFVLISIAGLAIGLGAALLITLYVHDELGYERWLEGSDRIHLISVRSPAGGMTDASPSNVRQWLESEHPQFEVVTRLAASGGFFQRDEHEFSEQVFWADANFFDVFRFPAVAGDLKGALAQPDSSCSLAAMPKYFGRPDPSAKRWFLDARTMTVTAVSSTVEYTFRVDVLAAVSAYSPITERDLIPMTVVRAKSGVPYLAGSRPAVDRAVAASGRCGSALRQGAGGSRAKSGRCRA